MSEPRRICAWCYDDLGPSPNTTSDSHGICAICDARFRAELAEMAVSDGREPGDENDYQTEAP